MPTMGFRTEFEFRLPPLLVREIEALSLLVFEGLREGVEDEAAGRLNMSVCLVDSFLYW